MSVFNFNSGKNMSAYPQIQSDLTATNLNLHCDPRTVGTYFLDPQGNRVLDVESKAGKIAVEDDICNLTVNGKLTVKGQAEICDIICPEDFTVRAGRDVKLTAARGGSIQCTTGPLLLECQDTGQAGGAACCVSIAGHLNSKSGAVPGSTYTPTLDAATAANVIIVNGSVDTCGKLNLGTPLAQGDIIQFRFGTPFQNPPVVQITSTNPDITGVAATGEIALHQVSNVTFVLVCVTPNQANTDIHYTVIGQND